MPSLKLETLNTLKSAKTLRWVLGDQLNASHSWYRQQSDDVLYVIAELHQEASYTTHHAQKVCAFFMAMQNFAKALAANGHRVCYLTLDDTAHANDLSQLVAEFVQKTGCEALAYQRPDEYRLSEQWKEMSHALPIQVIEVDTEHFLVPFEELSRYFKPNTAVRMEAFYRKMRKRFDVLMNGDEPEGERWNFDAENRKSFTKAALLEIPEPLVFDQPTAEMTERLERHQINTLGEVGETLLWPTTRSQALELLSYFCEHNLPKFGLYQDAMTQNSDHQWSLYHSRISFALNAKMLHPMQVIHAAIDAYREDTERVNLAQVEGFVRQILGWREYVRGMYWQNMPDYADRNELNATVALPNWYWNGRTQMNCLQKSIQQTLDYSYAHHIQRLMVTGNFALLAGLSPDEVDDWYLGVYVDAIEWVEMPNTRGMALFADGGLIASKPYAASGNYINKMSDYCKGCRYNVKEKLGDDACPFNALYWHFLDRHKDRFGRNPRMAFPYKGWQKFSEADQAAILEKGDQLIANIEHL